jgi:hypothetical protein
MPENIILLRINFPSTRFALTGQPVTMASLKPMRAALLVS